MDAPGCMAGPANERSGVPLRGGMTTMDRLHSGIRDPGGRKSGWSVLVAVGVSLLFGVAHAGVVVTDHVVSQADQAQTRVPVTFGQVFKAGDVPGGRTVVATMNGRPVPLQVDAKATNADGSLRHAVLTVMVPKLGGGDREPLVLATAAASPAGSPVTLAQLLATRYDARASLDIGGKTYTASARALLEKAAASGDCGAWNTDCGVWLSGPLVSEWIVGGPLVATDGTVHPNLHVYFHVRAYAGDAPGSVADVRTDIVVENAWAYKPQAQPQYTARLKSGTADFASEPLTQYAYTRWHHVLWWNGDRPRVYLEQNTRYIQDSMAVSKYADLQPDEAFLAKVRQRCAPLEHCDQTNSMGNPGSQPAIGPVPRWTAVYIIDPDVRAYRWMLANTDALGTYSTHYRDHATGWPLSIRKHPYVTIQGWSFARGVSDNKGSRAAKYRKDLLPNCVETSKITKKCTPNWYSTGNPHRWSNAHQPAAGYVAYMVTGSYYYMEEMAFYASMSELEASANYRGYSKGLIDGARTQVRGKAWVLRELVDAAWLLPDGYPLKKEFNADVNHSLADFNAKFTNNPDANPLGMMRSGALYSVDGGRHNAGTPWQHNFLVWSVGHAAELGFPGAAKFRDWLGKFEIGLMTGWMDDPAHGFCWLEASAYNIKVKDASGNWLPDYAAVYAASVPTLVGLKCNSPRMVAALNKLTGRKHEIGEMVGYAHSPTGYPANLQIALATLVNAGLPGARTAWKIFQSRSVKPKGYNNYPNFALVPRNAGDAPPVSKTASGDRSR